MQMFYCKIYWKKLAKTVDLISITLYNYDDKRCYVALGWGEGQTEAAVGSAQPSSPIKV